ncbi:hypothetical protein BO86DRAFT_409322 [Aspergillus japonicus CBS 114.51]|uniref:Myb-like DNA-binding domain-containing protein n=2 Tax=Aspergillus TaxID=5052 RepID=A0A2V5H6W8_ASPV1|nr:hypothetical protein BO86DRAFT_409322 [Aspergillus japonicus CBS 114.51]PYI19291.1 hypothetical protein BO99DRAFT_443263 [Aspergillus violaceofuscus CBS 115571]RAH82568.1 hypothetical protein BO86DRAFT_409322 [Aspergillus japonicus CBS 114.51]
MAPNTPSKPRAPRLTADDQVQFLLSCIRNATGGGKIDFANVAKECDIVSKGAAAKRYERLLKANNIAPAGSSSNLTSKPTTDENIDEDEVDGLEAARAGGGAGKGRKRTAAAASGRKGKTSGLLARKKTKGQLMKQMAVARAHRLVGMSDSEDDTVKQEDGEEDKEEDGMAIKKEDVDEEAMLMEDENGEGEIGARREMLGLGEAGFDDRDQEGTV